VNCNVVALSALLHKGSLARTCSVLFVVTQESRSNTTRDHITGSLTAANVTSNCPHVPCSGTVGELTVKLVRQPSSSYSGCGRGYIAVSHDVEESSNWRATNIALSSIHCGADKVVETLRYYLVTLSRLSPSLSSNISA